MHIELWPINKPRPYAGNPRSISLAAIRKVALSIEQFGFQQPLVVDSAGVLIVGHTRLLAAQQLGLTEAPVLVANDLTDEQVRAYRIADNRTGEESDWDTEKLIQELEELGTINLDEMTGFDNGELETLLQDAVSLSGEDGPDLGATDNGFEYNEQYAVIVTCRNEAEQQATFEKLNTEGYTCKVVVV